MDYLKELGYLALGSRLKRLSDLLMQQCINIYKEKNVDFDPSYMPVFNLLIKESSLTISEIANNLKISQPAVTQFCNSLIKKDLINIEKDINDKRKKIVSLSEKGIVLYQELKVLWDVIEKEVFGISNDSGFNILSSVDNFEYELEKNDLFNRVINKLKASQLNKVEIIPFANSLAKYFKKLNYEWIEKYFFVEDIDKKVLSSPKKEIIDKKGHIIFAKYNSEVVGTSALIYENDSLYELSKMAVTNKYQGKQIGRKLMNASVELAKSLGAKKVYLISNRKLTTAINLYRKVGFVEIAFDQKSQYQRGDIKMELVFDL